MLDVEQESGTFVWIDWLAEGMVKKLTLAGNLHMADVARNGYEGRSRRSEEPPDLTSDLEAIQERHLNIEDDRLWPQGASC